MDENELKQRLLEAFKLEGEERLASITSNLLKLENASDPENDEVMNESVYRDLHSLKGASRSVDLLQLERLCQISESLFAKVREGSLRLRKPHYTVLHQLLDFIESCLSNGLVDSTQEMERTADSIFERFERLIKENLEGNDRTDDEDSALKSDVIDDSIHTQENEAELKVSPSESEVAAGEEEGIQPVSLQARNVQSLRIDSRSLDRMLLRSEELLSIKLSEQARIKEIRSLLQELQAFNSTWGTHETDLLFLKKSIQGFKANERFNPQYRHLSSVYNWQQDLKERCSDLVHELRRIYEKSSTDASSNQRVIDDMLEAVKTTAIQPVGLLVNPLTRIVRDLATQQGKAIKLLLEGSEHQVDRRILEELKTPLMHLIRNAVDHGIESPEERAQSGKGKEATIHVGVTLLENDEIEICVSDDGYGIDTNLIKEKAISKRLFKESDILSMQDSELMDLIFHSGFSTSAIITELSGRGLGLPIVKEALEKLGGTISVASTKGMGTRFLMRLPVSMAAFRGLVVKAAGQQFILPVSFLMSSMRFSYGEVKKVENRATLFMEGKPVPLLDLPQLLGDSFDPQESTWGNAVILKSGQADLALRVDEVIGFQELLLKPFPNPLVRIRNISAATILGDGSLALILDVGDLFHSSRAVEAIDYQAADDNEVNVSSILVVEDSITSRTLLKNVLETAGYDVDTAVDGKEGLDVLGDTLYDLVISDVEMPRMDGFSLTENIRLDDRLKDIPVILVTSLASQEHMERGVDAGADAYIVKSQFDQENLLETVSRLLP